MKPTEVFWMLWFMIIAISIALCGWLISFGVRINALEELIKLIA